jgi:hypothetical protein
MIPSFFPSRWAGVAKFGGFPASGEGAFPGLPVPGGFPVGARRKKKGVKMAGPRGKPAFPLGQKGKNR